MKSHKNIKPLLVTNVKSLYLLSLSKRVLSTSGIMLLVPADCTLLKDITNAKTKLFVSEVALQRIYGFIPERFPPSLYTLNVLASYCGFENWKTYCERQDDVCKLS